MNEVKKSKAMCTQNNVRYLKKDFPSGISSIKASGGKTVVLKYELMSVTTSAFIDI